MTMKKRNNYFSHDYGARNDPRLVRLNMVMGMEGHGIFWGLVEILHESGGFIDQEDIGSVAFELHTDVQKVERVLTGSDLFHLEDGRFSSHRVLRNLNQMEKVSLERSKAGRKGAASTNARLRRGETHGTEQLPHQLAEPVSAIAGQPERPLTDEVSAIERQINKEINKEKNRDNISLFAGLSAIEREKIFEIFVFERGWDIKTSERELSRFENYYIPCNWTRRGDNKPVGDRVALSRSWTPENSNPPTILFPDKTIRGWLSEVYAAAVRSCDADAFSILHGIEKVRSRPGILKPVSYDLFCQYKASECIERHLIPSQQFELYYKPVDVTPR